MENKFPLPDKGSYSYIFSGFEGKDCFADITAKNWSIPCFGYNAKFRGVIMEYCVQGVVSGTELKDLVLPGGFFLHIGVKEQLRQLPGFVLRSVFKHPYPNAALYIRTLT